MQHRNASRLLLSAVLCGAGLAPLAARADLDAGLRAYREQNWSRAAQELAPEAAAGNSQAQYYLGLLYSDGHGVPLDNARAFALFMASARQGDRDGQNAVGYCYSTGECANTDAAAAVEWFRKAAANGSAKALRSLGIHYQEGLGVARDVPGAIGWFTQAAEQRDVEAMYRLGELYFRGAAGRNQERLAFAWMEKAATAGDVRAQVRVGRWHWLGMGTAESPAAAKQWFLKAAQAGNAEGQYELAMAYQREKNYEQARLWLQRAADQGHSTAGRSFADLDKSQREHNEKTAAEQKARADHEAWWAAQSPARRARRADIEKALENTYSAVTDFRFECARNTRNVQRSSGPPGSMLDVTRERDRVAMYARDFERCMRDYEPPSLQSMRPVWPLLLPDEQQELADGYRAAYADLVEDGKAAARHIQAALADAEGNYEVMRRSEAASQESDRQWRATLRAVANQIQAVGNSMKPPPPIDRVAFDAAVAESMANKAPSGGGAGASAADGAGRSAGAGTSSASAGSAGTGGSGRSGAARGGERAGGGGGSGSAQGGSTAAAGTGGSGGSGAKAGQGRSGSSSSFADARGPVLTGVATPVDDQEIRKKEAEERTARERARLEAQRQADEAAAASAAAALDEKRRASCIARDARGDCGCAKYFPPNPKATACSR